MGAGNARKGREVLLWLNDAIWMDIPESPPLFEGWRVAEGGRGIQEKSAKFLRVGGGQRQARSRPPCRILSSSSILRKTFLTPLHRRPLCIVTSGLPLHP